MGTVEAVHAHRADLDGLSESLANLAPDRTPTGPITSSNTPKRKIATGCPCLFKGFRQTDAGRLLVCTTGEDWLHLGFSHKPGHVVPCSHSVQPFSSAKRPGNRRKRCGHSFRKATNDPTLEKIIVGDTLQGESSHATFSFLRTKVRPLR